VSNVRLPLPVARLHRRSFNAKSAKDRHDTAYFAWEVSVRLGVAAAPPANAGTLARASVGPWCAALKPKDRPLGDPALLALFASLTEAATGTRSERQAITPRDLLDALPAYRNKVLGHGSARQPSFYEEAGRALLAGLEVAWREHLFLSQDAILAHVDSVSLDASGGRVARALDLSTETPIVVDGGTTRVPDTVLPRRLYLRQGTTWRALHPWLLFDDEAERLWCFNGLGRRAEYLDYASGETLSGAELEKAFAGTETALKTLLGASETAVEAGPEAPVDERRFGDYEVLGKLGEGGMGAVYLARQTSLGRTVALKMLPPDRAKDPIAVGRFQREVRALAKCEHPNVVKIFASGEARGTHYYAMEFVDGADLGKVAKALSSSPDFVSAVSSAFEFTRGERSELFPGLPAVPRRPATTGKGEDRWRQMARFFAQAARGLAHLHENGIVHRDISPGNVMVTWPDERAVIMDLGLAAIENATVTLTKDKSAILGTLRYIAPEQLQKHLVEVDRRVDVYSFGATMYELFAGRPIFDGETEPRLITQVLREEPKLLSKVEPRLPIEIAHIVHKALEKDPARRYSTAADLAADLEAFLAGEPIQARAPTVGYRVRRWVRRRREMVIGGSIGLVIAAGIAAYSVHHARSESAGKRLLAAASHFDRLRKDADALGSQLPEALPSLEAWIERAVESLEGSADVAGLDELRGELDRIAAGSRRMTDEEVRTLTESEPKFGRVARLRELAAWQIAIHAHRSGRAEPRFDERSVQLAPVEVSWNSLNEQAWKWVDPDKLEDEREMHGLAMARRALELVLESAPSEAWTVRNTWAWALFAAGRDEEARIEIRRAHDEAPDADKARVDVERLERMVEAASTPEQVGIAGRAARHLDAVARAVENEFERRKRAAIDDPARRGAYEALVRLVGDLEMLNEPEIGRLARVKRWAATARTLHERTISSADAREAWTRALASIRQEFSKYDGLEFEPQLGLHPIGRDPSSGLFEFVHLASGEAPVRAADGRLQITEDSGIVLVLLPGGIALVGAQNESEEEPHFDGLASDFEAEIVDADLDPFFVGKHEVTLAQWWRLTGREPNALLPGRIRGGRMATRRNPVERVSFDECEKVLGHVGLRLPTEVQFEYANRAGTTTAWWTGAEPQSLFDAANVRDESYGALGADTECEGWDDGWAVHAPIGSLRANAFGLHDTAGNVFEWCRDLSSGPSTPPAQGDGLRAGDPGVKKRMVRGGGWGSFADLARSACRDHEDPTYSGPTLGIRAVRKLEGKWSTKDGRASSARGQ